MQSATVTPPGDVVGPPIASFEVAWTPPTAKTDGSVLEDLAGYRFYYGTTPGVYNQMTAVSNPGLTRFVVDSVPAGTYYVAMTAFRANGIESALSNEITKQAN
ncbi:MAG: hypothetical protein AAGL69_06945 [Pseudomonadota bacterium]